ncbi:MAG: universal stress protein [Actinomycetota bacterium]
MKRFLYATNGGKPAQDAGVLVRRFAGSGKVRVTVDICKSIDFAFPQEGWAYGVERKARPQPDELAATEVAAFKAAGFEADSLIGSGVPALQILEQMGRGGYELAVLGAGSAKWMNNLLLGSTSTRILHSSKASVLIVHHHTDGPGPVRIILATDRSEDATEAVRQLIDFADPARVAVTVVSVADEVPTIQRLVPDGLTSAQVGEYLQEEARKSVELAAGPLREAGFQVTEACPTGDPVRELLALAKEMDLVVCGSRGMGGPSRLVLGSVSDQLARLAPATMVCRKAGSDPATGG